MKREHTNIKDFYEAVGPYVPKLLTIARIKLGNAFDAEDAVEDALLKAYDHYHALRSRDKLYPWLRRILINHINDLFKAKDPTVDITSIIYHLTDGNQPYDEKQSQIETIEKILDCMLVIEPIEYAEVLILHYYRQFSYERIAEETGVPVGTIKSRLSRARDAFVKEVKNAGIPTEEIRTLRMLSEWPSVKFS